MIAVATAQAAPLEVYGQLPSVEKLALSPDGTRVAFIRAVEDERLIGVGTLGDPKPLGLLHIGEAKVRSVEWADDNHLMIVTSVTALPTGLMGDRSEWSQLLIYDVARRRLHPVPDPRKVHDSGVMNVIAGRVMVRRVDDHTVLFFPTVYVTYRTFKALVRVDLDSGLEKVVRYGSADSLGWLVDAQGQLVAEQNYSEKEQRWSLSVLQDGKFREVAGGQASVEFPRLLGFGPTADALLMQSGGEDGDPVWRLLSLKDGSLGPPMAEGKSLAAPIDDRLTHRLIGGFHWDDYERYVFFEPAVQARWNGIVQAYKDDHVRFVSASDDFKKMLVLVEGPKFGYQYDLVDFATHDAQWVANVYEGIAKPLEVRRIDYPAADGLRIPAYLTLPQGRPARNLALVVLVHGGPVGRDTADFDWWSQALADQGYAVLQANFRGSAVNPRFIAAGFGEFGRKMQTDLSDGVRYLVKEGIADPQRVCVVGASYGGYAALAGATLDPGTYRCAVSVAGISDLRGMLKRVNEQHLDNSNREQRYWDRFIGVTGPNDPMLKNISPIHHVESVSVPILLIHGKDDTVVPYDQSDDMYEALRRAAKSVEFVKLKHEDHWLSHSGTRLQMLQATVAFLRKHNPPD
jgi:dipeptidyl aminopeptidase/acylaminoacyl peptidase